MSNKQRVNNDEHEPRCDRCKHALLPPAPQGGEVAAKQGVFEVQADYLPLSGQRKPGGTLEWYDYGDSLGEESVSLCYGCWQQVKPAWLVFLKAALGQG